MKRKIVYLLSVAIAALVAMSSITAAGAVNTVSNEINFGTKTESLYLLNLDTDTVVYQKAAQDKRYPASTTKIMTYIITAENVKDPDTTQVTIKQDLLAELEGTDSSEAGVAQYAGQKLTVTELLYAMMVSSGNDAALVLADYVGGGDTNKFVEMMNNKAKDLGCKNTHYVNPHGLHDEKQYTTAEDLATITKQALTEKYFSEITNTVTHYLPAPKSDDGEQEQIKLTTTNTLINPEEKDYYYEFAKGIKTGTTDEAGHCLVSSALKGGTSYLCVALNAPIYDEDGNALETNYAAVDSKNLYEWVFNNIEMKTILGEQDKVCEININYANGQDKLGLVPQYSYATMLPKDLDENKIKIETQSVEEVDAPIQKGDVLGTATVSYNGKQLTRVNIVASETLERSEFIYAMTVAKNIVTSTWFIIAACVILVLLIVYIVLITKYKKNKKVNSPREL